MGGVSGPRNKSAGTIAPSSSLRAMILGDQVTADDREKISNGPNDRPLNETIAGTGPGIPDEALVPGAELPTPPTAEKRIRERLGIREEAEVDTLPLEGE